MAKSIQERVRAELARQEKATLVDGEHISNVKVEYYGTSDRYSISCEHKGLRYHFWWWTGATAIPAELYKNPPLHLGPGSLGYFHTRCLRPLTSKPALALVHAMWNFADSARLEAARLAYTEQLAADARARADAEQLEKVRDAAPDLLAALELTVKALSKNGSKLRPVLDAARAALAKVSP
jgi:hypothetical protein